MQVEINATTVNQIVNADVIGMDQIRELSSKEKDELLAKLVNAIEAMSEALSARPTGVSTEQMRKMAEATNLTMKGLSNPSVDSASKKDQIGRLFETFRTHFGEAADIVLTTVKLAQASGLFGGQ